MTEKDHQTGTLRAKLLCGFSIFFLIIAIAPVSMAIRNFSSVIATFLLSYSFTKDFIKILFQRLSKGSG